MSDTGTEGTLNPNAAPDGGQGRTLIERVLSPIADVRRERGRERAADDAADVPVLAAYYLLKTAREVFILTEGGAEVKSYSSAGQAMLLLALVPAYGAFASRVNRVRLVTWVTLFFAVEPACCSSSPCRPACASASSISCGSASST